MECFCWHQLMAHACADLFLHIVSKIADDRRRYLSLLALSRKLLSGPEHTSTGLYVMCIWAPAGPRAPIQVFGFSSVVLTPRQKNSHYRHLLTGQNDRISSLQSGQNQNLFFFLNRKKNPLAASVQLWPHPWLHNCTECSNTINVLAIFCFYFYHISVCATFGIMNYSWRRFWWGSNIARCLTILCGTNLFTVCLFVGLIRESWESFQLVKRCWMHLVDPCWWTTVWRTHILCQLEEENKLMINEKLI